MGKFDKESFQDRPSRLSIDLVAARTRLVAQPKRFSVHRQPTDRSAADPAQEARRQSLLVSTRASEREALAFIERVGDLCGQSPLVVAKAT
jgi:hypothetical protein